MKPPFVIFSMPRSRSFWLSRFLAYGGWECGHDEARHMRQPEDIASWFAQGRVGAVETAGATHWRYLCDKHPGVRILTMRRPIDEILDSLVRAVGDGFDRVLMRRHLEKAERKLDQIEARTGCTSLTFADLATESGCQRVFEECLPFEHDRAWWSAMEGLNLQVNLLGVLRYYEAHKPQLERLSAILAQSTRSAAFVRSVSRVDGVVIQQEPFNTFYDDGTALFREHMALVGEHPNGFPAKNIALMRWLDRVGMLQCTTARVGGVMVGYLMAVIGPELDDPDRLSAEHKTFFVSSRCPGIGMRLQGSSVAALSARGVSRVEWKAGKRGSGDRLPIAYKRIGAASIGELFVMNL
jgi:hypothetical protein